MRTRVMNGRCPRLFPLKRDGLAIALFSCLRMISPENRFALFRIMLYLLARTNLRYQPSLASVLRRIRSRAALSS